MRLHGGCHRKEIRGEDVGTVHFHGADNQAHETLQLCSAEAVYFDTYFPLGVGLQSGLAFDPGGRHIEL